MKKKLFEIKKESITGPLFFLGLFLGIAVWRYSATGEPAYFIIFGYIGLTIAVAEFLSSALIPKYKHVGRKISLVMIGLFMLCFLGFLGAENMQIEGFFFYLFAGIFSGATLHYFIAKLAGPLYFGRGWCGWACWTVMVTDFFPWKVPKNPRIAKLGLLRYIHFAFALALTVYLFYFTEFDFVNNRPVEMKWLIIGNAVYYLAAILLAFFLKDNRAVCKYFCPIPATMKPFSRFAFLKQEIDTELCDECCICEDNCPMNIKLLEYSSAGKRVLSTECILCDTCKNVCPQNAIRTTQKLDFSWRD